MSRCFFFGSFWGPKLKDPSGRVFRDISRRRIMIIVPSGVAAGLLRFTNLCMRSRTCRVDDVGFVLGLGVCFWMALREEVVSMA